MSKQTIEAIKSVLKRTGEALICMLMGCALPAMLLIDVVSEDYTDVVTEPEWQMIRWKQPDMIYDSDEGYIERTVMAGATTIFSKSLDEVTVVTSTSKDWDEEESYLLAKIAMAEAENQSMEGKALVICTVLNRVRDESFPGTIKDVIFQERNGVYQFSPIGDGRWEKVEPNEDCWGALEMVMQGWDDSQGALYFEKTSNNPTWHSKNLERLFEHQDVTFYTEKDK